ncbi:thiamine diphosphokinase [Roseobacter ponti]|uniref:Thiamine diphosphokinase n=1 Tax=Roseobacter ponti TaxID=1891787 RepID=A0A858SWP8_9RHOB|nr:thiamine diphosphokinase [Roseobacter ponti]QJF52053.1 thiamine diphosphokinase [Roseobacter ponti]
MKNTIVESHLPVTLVGGGSVGAGDLAAATDLAPVCVAADGGADAALGAGYVPVAVIGDMDSISPAGLAQIPPENRHPVTEQDSTDFDKALRNINAPLIIAVGFSGGRTDHQLAALSTMVVRCDSPVVLLTERDVVFLCPPQMSLRMEAGTRVSLFPMGPVTGRSQGLKWPVAGISFEPGKRAGTSNLATGDLELEMHAPLMLCLLPREFLGAVAALFTQLPAQGRWPARAERHRDLPPSL